MRNIILGLLFAVNVYAGQSLVLTSSTTGTLSDPAATSTQDLTTEFQFHAITFPVSPNQGVFSLTGSCVTVLLQPFSGGTVQINDNCDGLEGGVPCIESGLTQPLGNYLFRVRRDHLNMFFTCEALSFDGTQYQESSQVITSLGTGTSGGTLGGGGQIDIGFLRVLNGLIPLGSRPPTTFYSELLPEVLELKFDGTLTDSSGNGNNATVSAGGPTYTATPNQVAVGYLKTLGNPSWLNWTSLRAGNPATLDTTSSYSLADSSNAVSVFLQCLSGPSTVTWSSHTAAQPIVTGLIFGTYNFQVQATDVNGSISTVTQQVGVVATDSNGVVSQGNPSTRGVFGDMIAFGQNPWGWEDNRHWQAFLGQSTYLPSTWGVQLTWPITEAGTASYPFSGVGQTPGTGGTTLCAPLTATALTITVCDASTLHGLANLPTFINVGNAYNATEVIWITGAVGNVLTVAHDGRGIGAGATAYTITAQPASMWGMGTIVGEYRISGTGTHFITDSQRPLCPGGIGPPGAVVYSSGSIIVNAGSPTVTGSNTNWMTSISAGDWLSVTNPTYLGTPFYFWSQVAAVNSDTSLTMTAAAPADIDSGPYSYKVMTPRFVSLGFTAPNGAPEQALQNLWGCLSDTAAFGGTTHDILALDGSTQTGSVSYKDHLGANNQTGPNFYGSGLAMRSLYYRSGYLPALTLANYMDDYWARDPEICAGYCGGDPLNAGGGTVGAAANATTNASALVTYPDIGGFVALGPVVAAATCNDYDSRDSSALESGVMHAALFDPNPTRQAAAQGVVANLLTHEQGCQQSDHSWANTADFNPAPAQNLTLTNGSATVTGTGLTSGLCLGVETGTITVTKGSVNFTTSGTAGPSSWTENWKLDVTGTMNGGTYIPAFEFITSGTSGSFAAYYPGDSGTFPYLKENGTNNYFTAFGVNNSDPMLKENYGCTYVNSTTLILNRPWDGPTGSTYALSTYILPGYGQQPYMLGGYKSNVLRLGQESSGSTGTAFTTLFNNAGGWLKTYGFDLNTLGFNYVRTFGLNPANNVTGACEPTIVANPAATVPPTTNCQEDDPRPLNAEGGLGLMQSYIANPTNSNKSFVDTAYGAVYGSCPYTQAGFYCDGNIPTLEDSDAYLASYKWPGFFFGMGGFFSNSWPAIRQGGLTPPNYVPVSFGFDIPNYAVSATCIATLPNSATVTATVTGNQCSLSLDDTQGKSILFNISYRTGTGAAVTGPAILISIP